MTYRDIIYMCLDLVKLSSEDTYITPEHVLFLVSKVRSLILKQRYSDIKKEIPESNQLTLCLNFEPSNSLKDVPCMGTTYLRSTQKVPALIPIGTNALYPSDFYGDIHITLVSRDRMRYVGHNKWLKNIIYASLGPDHHIYLISLNPLFKYLKKATMTGVFENPEDIDSSLSCLESENSSCDIMDKEFPLEDSLVTTVIEMVVKYLAGAAYRPQDTFNNSSDDLSNLVTFIKNNMNSNFQRQLTNE